MGVLLSGLLPPGIGPTAFAAGPSHGFAYFGKLKYPADMTHFDFANPDAPKGGTVRVPGIGTFNNLNPYAGKGVLSYYVDPRFGAVTFEPLMRLSEDELGVYYGRLAKTVEVADDLAWVTYTLHEDARWHDGVSVTVEDVLWTFNFLKNDADIIWRSTMRDFASIEQTGPRSFRFTFAEDAEKTPHLIIQSAGFSVMAKHWWTVHDPRSTTLEPPLGNGPYRVAKVDPGHSVIFERVLDYWAKDLPITRGQFNFDKIVLTYFFDTNVMLQALRAGLVDYYRDQNEDDFATAYNFSGFEAGLFKKETYVMGNSYGMHYGLAFNLRRQLFEDIRLREALTLAYNFEWSNRVLWYSGMERNHSFFVRSGMQAKGLPSDAEIAVLEPFRSQVPPRVFTHPLELPISPTTGRNRDGLRQADRLLKDAGWIIRDHVRVHKETGEPLTFEMVVSYAEHERMLLPYVDNLKQLGINARLRKLESNLMVNRLRNYDYDATVRKIYTYTLPYPSRMRSQFTSAYADVPNMTNYAGIRNPVVDALVEAVASASVDEEMFVAGRALDRVLRWNFYVIPDGHQVGRHIVYWDRFGHPTLGAEHLTWTGFPHLWWLDAEKEARVDAGMADMRGKPGN